MCLDDSISSIRKGWSLNLRTSLLASSLVLPIEFCLLFKDHFWEISKQITSLLQIYLINNLLNVIAVTKFQLYIIENSDMLCSGL